MKEPSLEKIFGNYKAWEAKEGTWFINFMNGSENMICWKEKRRPSSWIRATAQEICVPLWRS